MLSPRSSYNDETKRDIPSFIEPRPPVILNPYMRPRPQKGTNLFDLLEDSETEEPELVQVYLRLKPCKIPSNLYEVRSDRSLITSLDTTTAGHGRRTQHNVSKMYTFSHIFGPDSNQKEIFEHVVKDNLKKLPDGNSFTLLTYGASGSGKTFTLMGTVTAPGLVPRSLEYVFKVVDAAQQPLYKPDERGADKLSYAMQEYELKWVKQLRQISAPVRDKYRRMSAHLGGDLTCSNVDLTNRRSHYVWVSFIEIYNEGIYDLLAPGDRKNAPKLAIREDTSGNVYVKGATQAFVRTGEEAYDVMVAGKHNLQVAATGIHAQSSRSHCIFTITMLTETDGGMRTACVRLCDLAGCERAARTRNTGARMQESRAINSSLHVLERCLRMLRRKRTVTAIVPYRESKLTRLLGAGLSGTRGEAVSMVVTLNPSPEYANETRHVLQLAAVAKDIQINDTLSEYPSTFDSSARDTTIGYNSMEVMRLRADNERLLFELKQAQARNKELMACIEEKKAANEKTLWEVAEEAKAIYTDYYEAEIKALQTKMDSMAEDYENRLGQASQPPRGDTPSKKYQNQIAQLMTDVAILEEKLSAERLARVRAEEEVQHLRTCIDERDEKSDEALEEKEDVISLTDSDHSDSEDDPCNESLEPTFRKEDINRSRMIRQSIIADFNILNPISDINDRTSDEGILENSSYTSKDLDKSNVSNVTDTYLTGEDSGTDRFNDSDRSDIYDKEIISTVKKATNLSRDTYFVDQVNDVIQTKVDHTKTQRPLSRETYCMPTTELLNTSVNNEFQGPVGTIKHVENVITKTQRPLSRETYCVPTSVVLNTSENNELQEQDNTINNEEIEITKSQRPLSRETYCVPTSDVHNSSKNDKLQEQMSTINNDANEIIKIQRPLSRETYCMATNEVLNTSKNDKLQEQMAPIKNDAKELIKIQRPLSRETYCTSTHKVLDTSKKEKLREPADKQRPVSRETYHVPSSKVLNISNDNKLPQQNNIQKLHDTATGLKDIVQDAVPKCLIGDNMIKVPNALKVESNNLNRVTHKILPDTYVKKILGSIKQSTESNESLAQFERLEMETNVIDNDKKRVTKEFFNIKHTKETRKYFDEDSLDKCGKTPATVVKNKDRKTYFDNPKEAENQIQIKIKQEKKSFFESNETESQKQAADAKVTKEIDYFRSPSIVRDNVTNYFEPSMFKKLLRKGYSRQGENEMKVSLKAHDSIDIFEELESPTVNSHVNAEIKKKDVESVRDSIQKIAISDKIVTAFDSTDTIETKSKNTNDTNNQAIKTSKKEVIVANSIESAFEIVIAKNAAVENTEMEDTVATESNLINNTLETLSNDESQLQGNNTKVNNTTVEFENIYKDVTVPRATEFDLLVSQESVDENHTNTENSESEGLKYNLRNKTKLEKAKTERKRRKNKVFEGEILLESVPKCESKSKPPRKNLGLRRQKNISDADVGKDKLKDIVNLQSEFSDVTMDIPAPLKTSEDIPSPEKVEDKENSPILGIQSCPAKSITRSRRKLFTPRAEPLEESMEKLSAERLARVRAEEEVQHLRTCIDERDEKSDEALEEKEDVISLTDSDHSDSEDDPCNESLEPTFRKEDINRSRMIRQSIIADFNILNPISDINDRTSDEGILENSSYTSKDLDKSNVSNVTDTYLTGEDSGTDRFNDSDRSDIYDKEIISTVKKATNLSRDTYFVDQVNDVIQTKVDHTKTQRTLSRETYCMPTTELLNTSVNNEFHGPVGTIKHVENGITKTQRPLSRETYCVPTSIVLNTSDNNELQEQDNTINNEEIEITKSQRPLSRETYCVPTSDVHNSSKNDKLQEQMSTINNDANEIIKIQRPLSRETYCMATNEVLNTSKNDKLQEQMAPINNDAKELIKIQRPLSRETYCTSTHKVLHTSMKEKLQEPADKQRPVSRETYYVPSSKVLNISNDKLPQQNNIQKLHDTATGLKDIVQDAVPKCLKGDNMIKVTNALKVESNNHNRVTHKILPDTYVKKILGSIKQSTASNESLAQFERLEMETYVIDNDKKRVTKEFFNIKHTKETRKYFDEDSLDKCGKTPATVVKNKDRKTYFDNPKEAEDQIPIKIKQEKKSFFESNETESQKQAADAKFIKEIDYFRSPSIVRENVTNYFEPSMFKKLLGKGYSRQGENEMKVSLKAHDSVDIFEELESPTVNSHVNAEIKKKDVESVRDSIEKIAISDKIVTALDSTDTIETKSKNTNDTDNQAIKTSKKDVIVTNSIESDFEIVIAKNAAVENTEMEDTVATESNLINNTLKTLSNDESQLQGNNTKVNNTTVEFENIYKDVTVPRATEFDLLVSQESVDENHTNTENSESEDFKYNLRNKTKLEKAKTERKRRKNKVFEGEIVLESVPKCESKSKPPRKNLGLRRQKNISDADVGKDKLKDIVNLQSEFSDVIMDIPAPLKTSEDIPSPEKVEDKENSPILGIQSCPAKSITRSRRKLFTPRAEPLEESMVGTGDSNDRIRVPRPSYHRPRARRKL